MRYSIAFFSLLFIFFGQAGYAEEKQYLLQESTYKALTSAQELMDKSRFSQARDALIVLEKKAEAGSYDRAVVQQTLGYAYSSLEQYSKARVQFQKALDSGALPEKVSHGLRYNLGQLLIADEQYRQGTKVLEAWLKVEPSPPNTARVLISSAYYQIGQYAQVVKHMKVAVRSQKEPADDWYQLLLAGHIELKQYKSAITISEKLLVRHPNETSYWVQLSSLYAQQNKQTSALAVQVLAAQLKQDDPKVMMRIVDMYRYLQIPYKAATLLKSGMDKKIVTRSQRNLTKLADSWLAARERKKAAVILKGLASSDASGESDLKYGRVLFDMEQWKQASSVFKQSLTELKGKPRGRAALMAGLSYFYLEDYNQAKVMLEQASRYAGQGQQARYWLQYIEQLTADPADEEETVS